jgi:hypothetical protein
VFELQHLVVWELDPLRHERPTRRVWVDGDFSAPTAEISFFIRCRIAVGNLLIACGRRLTRERPSTDMASTFAGDSSVGEAW